MLLGDLYIKKDVLETILKTMNAKGIEGISLTFSVSDKTNDYNQNVWMYVSQTKDEREAKKKPFTVGNGKLFWENGEFTIIDKDKNWKNFKTHLNSSEPGQFNSQPAQQQQSSSGSADDLPF